MRYFAAMTEAEVAAVMQLSPATVRKDVATARFWRAGRETLMTRTWEAAKTWLAEAATLPRPRARPIWRNTARIRRYAANFWSALFSAPSGSLKVGTLRRPASVPTRSLRLIGAGGMGKSTRRATRLGRDVAIGIAAAVARDRSLARLGREARVLAILSHPHLGAIYGFEEAASALVLELIDGETLADRLAAARWDWPTHCIASDVAAAGRA